MSKLRSYNGGRFIEEHNNDTLHAQNEQSQNNHRQVENHHHYYHYHDHEKNQSHDHRRGSCKNHKHHKHHCELRRGIECGTSGGSMTFTLTGNTFDAANVTVDHRDLREHTTILMFSCLVNTMLDPRDNNLEPPMNDGIDGNIILQFQLMRKRDGGSPICIGSYTYERFSEQSNDETNTSDTFSFNSCICRQSCCDCVDYFVRVTATNVSPFDTVGSVHTARSIVSNGELIAITQEN